MRNSIIALGLILSANTYALTIDLEVKAFQKVLFEKVDSDTLKKANASIEVKALGRVQQDGEVVNINNSQPPQYDYNKDMTLKLVNKNSLQLIDETDGINKVISANIDKTWTGKIKSIVINKDVYQSLYNEQIEALGGAIFGQFGVSQGNTAFSFSLELDNFECSKENDGLVVCMQTLTFKVSGSDEVSNPEYDAQKLAKAKAELKAAKDVLNSYVDSLDTFTRYDINSYISILREARDAFYGTESNISNKEVAKQVERLSSDIHAEILDSYNYTTAKGEYIRESFYSIIDRISKIEAKL
jgi:hypothetical protein